MPDAIRIIQIEVDIHENGIIRLTKNGILIGRLVDRVGLNDVELWSTYDPIVKVPEVDVYAR